MDKDHDAILVELAQKGDKQALIALYHTYINPIYRYIYSKVGSKIETEDITSEVFLKMVKNLQNFKT